MSLMKNADKQAQIGVRILYCVVLLSSVTILASAASDIMDSFRSGSAVDTDALASFVQTASLVPLLTSFFLAREMQVAKFTKANELINAFAFWCFGLGTFTNAILTADTTAPFWFWLSLVSGAVMMLCAPVLMIRAISKPSAT